MNATVACASSGQWGNKSSLHMNLKEYKKEQKFTTFFLCGVYFYQKPEPEMEKPQNQKITTAQQPFNREAHW